MSGEKKNGSDSKHKRITILGISKAQVANTRPAG